MTIETISTVGAPKGNDNARKGKLFYGELRKVLVQEDARKLRAIANKLVDAAQEGEPPPDVRPVRAAPRKGGAQPGGSPGDGTRAARHLQRRMSGK